jgi:molybdenum cofactor biosynthesis protein B
MAYEAHVEQAKTIAVRCAVITLSDTRTPETDGSGNRIIELLTDGGNLVPRYQLLPDDPEKLTSALREILGEDEIDAIITNGGTGISRRDQTIDAIEKILERTIPGFGELFRMLSWEQVGSGAMLSRAVGGIAARKLIFALPGSTKAVELAMTKLILPEIKHLVREVRK